MSNDKAQVHIELVKISGFEALQPGDYDVERLGGLTNLVYRIEHGDKRYALRIPGSGTEEYIDRKVEAHNARVAARAQHRHPQLAL